MKTITIKGGLLYDTDPLLDSLGWCRWSIAPYFDKPGEERGTYISVRAIEIDVEVPEDFDPRKAKIDALEKKRTEARAAFQATMTEIDRQISQLLAIENSAEAA